jgi:hypothetical protein
MDPVYYQEQDSDSVGSNVTPPPLQNLIVIYPSLVAVYPEPLDWKLINPPKEEPIPPYHKIRPFTYNNARSVLSTRLLEACISQYGLDDAIRIARCIYDATTLNMLNSMYRFFDYSKLVDIVYSTKTCDLWSLYTYVKLNNPHLYFAIMGTWVLCVLFVCYKSYSWIRNTVNSAVAAPVVGALGVYGAIQSQTKTQTPPEHETEQAQTSEPQPTQPQDLQ